MFNPIILDQKENFLEWLNPELIEVEETNEIGELRTVSVSYPIVDDIKHTKELFRIGNKLWIPKGAGLTNCLYVISSECKQDYFDKNTFTFEAEDILVELNYVELWEQETTKTITINETNLNKWFGMYYHIGTIENCTPVTANSIENNGTMSKMEWLRYIEQQTGNIFTTRYEKNEDSNIILRYLDFKNPNTIGKNHANNIIDLGYNSDNIVYEIDESDTFRAIAPIFSLANEDGNNITGTTVTREELSTVINNWKNHVVTKGTSVPMILERDSEGKIKEPTAYWIAPFSKNSGEMFIYDPVDTGAEYNLIRPRKDYEGELIEIPKIGTIETSETDKRIIFNNCCNTLLEKRYPTINLEIELKDLNEILGSDNSYDVYDTLYVKVPELTHLVECRIVKTVKNPHTPNENKVSLSSTSLVTKVNQIATQITDIASTITVKKGKYLAGFLKTTGVNVIPEVLDNMNVTIAVVKPDVTKTVSVITKTPVKSSSKQSAKSTITVKAKPTCAYNCGSWKWYTTTFVNECPFCKAKGKKSKLKYNPKNADGGELTCSVCGADFCGVCGREKRVPSRKRLTKVKTSSKKSTTKYKTSKTTKKVTDKGWTKVYNIKTNSNGKFEFKIPFDSGEYDVTISYGGSIEYGMCSRNVKLTVS